MEKWFNVGKIVNTHGIKGEVRVISVTDFPEERYAKGSRLYLFLPRKKKPEELIVKSHRKHKNFDLLTFEGYDHIDQAEKLKGGILKVHESQLSPLEEGEFYFYQIIGCAVYTTGGEEIGTVKEILTPGANDVWVVKSPEGKEYLIPYIEPVVKKVDIEKRMIEIEPMEGLLS